jgi:septum formation protein
MIVLASASPRRRTLLGEAGIAFRVEVAGVDEDLAAGVDPEAGARELAERKARAVVARLRGGIDAARTWVIGADTVVAVSLEVEGSPEAGWRLLGKPADPREAAEMLALLSSSRHRVITGVCVLRADGGAREVASETTWVTMRRITPEEIEAYVASEEWRDKAGGYAIQENADAFVTRLEEGGFDNVVGLPVPLTLSLLARSGIPAEALSP